MNFRLLSKILGTLLCLIALAMGVSASYAHFADDGGFLALAISAGITFTASLAMLVKGKGSGNDILRREGMVVVGLGWIMAAAFGMLPYLLCAPRLGLVDAFFESVSGFTTTGSTVIEDLDPWPRSLLFWRSLTQWLGGMGIIVLFVAVLSYLGVGSKALMRHETSAQLSDGASARVQRVAAGLWLVYLGLTLVCFLGLWILGLIVPGLDLGIYDALTHTFTTISTGGFSPYNASLGHFDSLLVEIWVALFMLASSVSFMLYALIIRSARNGDWARVRKRLALEEEARAFLLIVAVTTIGIAVSLVLHADRAIGDSLRASFFTVTSIITTGGFVTDNYDHWPVGAWTTLLMLTVIGGCSGSTAGGIKVSRVLLMLRISYSEVVRSFRPNLVEPLKLNGAIVDERSRLEPLLFISLSALICLLGTVLAAFLDPSVHDFETALGATVATLYNTGPGFGEVGADNTYAALHGWTKLMLSLFMILGRLELFAVLVLFVPSLWRRY